jgi:prophage regulatory protein
MASHRKPHLPDTIPREGYLREALILHFIPISRTSWKNGIRDGRFPKPIKMGRCNLWRAQDIHAVIAAIEGKSAMKDGQQRPGLGTPGAGNAFGMGNSNVKYNPACRVCETPAAKTTRCTVQQGSGR